VAYSSNNYDDDNDGDSHRGHSRGFLERGKQAFNLLQRTSGSSCSGAGERQRTRSPPPSKRWNCGVDEVVTDDGGQGRIARLTTQT
jgi:hypothetical protein